MIVSVGMLLIYDSGIDNDKRDIKEAGMNDLIINVPV